MVVSPFPKKTCYDNVRNILSTLGLRCRYCHSARQQTRPSCTRSNCYRHQRRRSEELKLDDTLHLPSELTAVVISEKFERAWRNTVRRGHPSISAAFHALFARYVICASENRLEGSEFEPNQVAHLRLVRSILTAEIASTMRELLGTLDNHHTFMWLTWSQDRVSHLTAAKPRLFGGLHSVAKCDVNA